MRTTIHEKLLWFFEQDSAVGHNAALPFGHRDQLNTKNSKLRLWRLVLAFVAKQLWLSLEDGAPIHRRPERGRMDYLQDSSKGVEHKRPFRAVVKAILGVL